MSEYIEMELATFTQNLEQLLIICSPCVRHVCQLTEVIFNAHLNVWLVTLYNTGYKTEIP
jgi:hypothetical protein